MNPVTEGIFIGVCSALLITFLTFLSASLVRMWHAPKRLDRLEKVVPVIIRSLLAILRCQKAGICNGNTDDAIKEIEDLLSEGLK
ncbi:MAG: hypothetical protein LAO04_21625 [Acidobacteriia bacterium]|nr:hypothetical protein [Terriglobia bacterium]